VLRRVTSVVVLTVLGLAGCGGSSPPATTRAAAAPAAAATTPAAAAGATEAPHCRRVPRTTVRLIASHGTARTHFAAGAAAAVRVSSGYAVSLVAITGGSQRMATWVVDRLRAPRTVASGNVAALNVTNWPLDAPGAGPMRQSQVCATQRMRRPGPVAP
jgi:hypothetical protein